MVWLRGWCTMSIMEKIQHYVTECVTLVMWPTGTFKFWDPSIYLEWLKLQTFRKQLDHDTVPQKKKIKIIRRHGVMWPHEKQCGWYKEVHDNTKNGGSRGPSGPYPPKYAEVVFWSTALWLIHWLWNSSNTYVYASNATKYVWRPGSARIRWGSLALPQTALATIEGSYF